MLLCPALALAQGTSPWVDAVNVLQTTFTGPIARGLSLVAIVAGGLLFAFGERQSKRAMARIVFGAGMAIGTVNFMAWLFLRHQQKKTMTEPSLHPVYRSLNRSLTILGAERRLFLLALIMGRAAFNFCGSLLAGLVMFVSLSVFALWATIADPRIRRIFLSSPKFRSRYDPTKFEPPSLTRGRS